MLFRNLPLCTHRKALLIEVKLMTEVVAKLISSIGSPSTMTNVIFQAEARTQVMLIFRSLRVLFLLHTAKVATTDGINIARPPIKVGYLAAILGALRISRHIVRILITLTHGDSKATYRDSPTHVERSAVFVAPIRIINVIATKGRSVLLIRRLRLAQIIIVQERIARAKR